MIKYFRPLSCPGVVKSGVRCIKRCKLITLTGKKNNNTTVLKIKFFYKIFSSFLSVTFKRVTAP